MNRIARLCVECAENCYECSREGSCLACLEGYALVDYNVCEKITYLVAELKPTNMTKVLYFQFKAAEGLDKIKEFTLGLARSPVSALNISVQNRSDNFIKSFSVKDVGNSSFYLQIEFSSNVSAGSRVRLDIAYLPWMDQFKTLKLKNHSIECYLVSDYIECPGSSVFSASKTEAFLWEKYIGFLIISKL